MVPVPVTIRAVAIQSAISAPRPLTPGAHLTSIPMDAGRHQAHYLGWLPATPPMTRAFVSMLLSILLIGSARSQFTPGRLAILEMAFVWNGTSYTIPANGGQLMIREFATDGTPGAVVAIPNTGPTMLVSPFQSGGASLTRSPSGDKLVFTGFTGTSDGSFNLTTSSSALVPRGIGTVDGAGNYQRPFTTSTFFSGAAPKVACTDGVNYWVGGGNSGVCYFGPGAPATINTDVTTVEDLHFVNGGLYRGAGSGGLQKVGSGSPITASAQSTLFAMSLLQGFDISPAGDVIYANNGSQIRKWVFSDGTWSNPYGFTAGTPLSRIVVDWSGAQPVIYAVKNSPSSLMKFIDAGAPSAGVTLASTNAGAWYGIAFTPLSNCVEGTACDDGNANTVNDIIRAGCACAGSSVVVGARVLLEGPFNGTNGLMNDALRTLPDFPLSEPYTALGMNPSGGAATIAPTVLAVTGNDAIVDWILVELRDAAVGTTVLIRTPALVQRDGDIVAMDGVSALQLPAETGSYRVAIRHRNHLGVMTANALSLSGTLTPIDFTTLSTATWGTAARKDLAGTQVLWCGEVVRNSHLSYTGGGNDRDPILATVGSTTPNNTPVGYRVHDVTMNGITAYTGTGNDRDPILVNVGSNTPNDLRVEQLP